MATTVISVPLDLEDLAYELTESSENDQDLIDFVLKLDDLVMDLDFTVKLRDKLNEVIAEEED